MLQLKERVIATALRADTLNSLLFQVTNNNGFSYNVATNRFAPNRGYYASIEAKGKMFYPKNDQDTIQQMQDFITDNLDELNNRNIYFGSWAEYDRELQCNKIYLDISVKFSNIRAARSFAQRNNQLAIYDAANKTSIYI